jgi:hypothetical protein
MTNKTYKEELREILGQLNLKTTTPKEDGRFNYEITNTAEIIEKLETYADRRVEEMANAAEMLWVVLANVSESDWSKQTPEWQEAAKRWRDNYLNVRPSLNTKTPLEEDNK